MVSGFEPSLYDKLFGDPPVEAVRCRLSLEQLKDSVARDLEALLNTRIVFDEHKAMDFPLARESVASFGLADFAGLCLASVHDKNRICASIEGAVAAHEPRLRDVKVNIELERKAINALYFSIRAVLIVSPAEEPVAFDAMLKPTSL